MFAGYWVVGACSAPNGVSVKSGVLMSRQSKQLEATCSASLQQDEGKER